jgi:hypothetical protein
VNSPLSNGLFTLAALSTLAFGLAGCSHAAKGSIVTCDKQIVVHAWPDKGDPAQTSSWRGRLVVELDDGHQYWISRWDGGTDTYPTGTHVSVCRVDSQRDKSTYYSIRDNDVPEAKLVDAPLIR